MAGKESVEGPRSPLFRLVRRLFAIKEVGVLLILLAMVGAMSVVTSSFTTRSNFISIIQAISPIAIMAIGETMVILTAGIDLSVGSVCALSAYLMSLVLTSEQGYSLSTGLAVALGTGGLCGLISGLIITKIRVTPFIVTLGMLSACSGLTLGLSGGKQIGLTKFGKPVEVTASILSPTGEVSGQPTVERRFYSESDSVEVILPLADGGAWIGASNPGHVSRLDANWNESLSIPLELDTVSSLVPWGEGSVTVAGEPGGKIWKIDAKGHPTLLCDTQASQVHDLQEAPDGSLWAATSSPSEAVHVGKTGEVLGRVSIEGTEALTSLTVDEAGQLFGTTRKPARVVRISPDGAPSVLYESTSEVALGLRSGEEGTLWFVEGEARPDRLMVLREGKPELIWQTPKPPVRDFLVFPSQIVVACVGNVGATYLIRPGFETAQIHPMTTHKARTLASLGNPESPILVGNSGPGGVATLDTIAIKTVYPVAESFNGLFEYAPWAMVVLMVLGWLFLRFTTWGTYIYAIGGNEQAARLSGIHVDRIKIFAYTLTGILCGVAGAFLTSKLHTLDPSLAKGYELKVIAAVVIGGTSLMGGEGSVWGTLIGAALLYVLNYALVHLGMEDIWSDLFIGVVIILAAVIDSLRSRLPEILGMLRRRFG